MTILEIVEPDTSEVIVETAEQASRVAIVVDELSVVIVLVVEEPFSPAVQVVIVTMTGVTVVIISVCVKVVTPEEPVVAPDDIDEAVGLGRQLV